MTKKTHIIYSLISILAIVAYGGFIVKSSISDVDTIEETLPYEDLTISQTETVTDPFDEAVNVIEEIIPPETSLISTEASTAAAPVGFSPVFPTKGTVTKHFSLSHTYSPETRDWRAHSGIDISALPAEAVFATEDGTVTKCFQDPTWGNVIEISHGEYTSIYKNLSTLIMVKEGDSVSRGEKISGVGSTSISESGKTHLHFELKHYSDYVNPLEYLS